MTDEWQLEDDMDLVFVESVHSPAAASTIAIGEGVRRSDDRLVTFAGDWPPMLALAKAIRDTGEGVEARVPSWAILTVAPRSAA
jgi:hypothetical protein